MNLFTPSWMKPLRLYRIFAPWNDLGCDWLLLADYFLECATLRHFRRRALWALAV